MTIDEAIKAARSLQWEADNEWPDGWEPAAVRLRVGQIADAIDAYLDEVPEGERAVAAHAVVLRMAGLPYRSTVTPRTVARRF